jgi:ribosomal protein S18 acetylase RimI-like enzyme
MTLTIPIRPAKPADHDALADAFYKMWLDNGMTPADFAHNWKTATLGFMAETADCNQACAFVAADGDTVVGTSQGLVSRKLYPQALKPDVRKDGYIWGVYVDPLYRRQGLARRLTQACMDHLNSVGCTRVVLHASKSGQPVYADLGFGTTNEMRWEVPR